MKQFFKFMFASMLGVLVLIIFLIFFFAGIISLTVSKEKVIVKDNSILQITLSQPLKDRESGNPLSNFDLSMINESSQPGLMTMVKEIENAKDDNHIKGIFIDVSSVRSGLASIDELRNALIDFKKSKKFIVAYAESFSTGAYYLASVADKIYLNPQGEVDFKGLHAELLFFKGALEKLEIEPEVIRHGKFKSAVEPFILDKMSDENRKQIGSLIDDLWNHMREKIADVRKIESAELEQIADSLSVQDASDALKYKLVDGLFYYDDVEKILKQKSGVGEKEKLNLISLSKYADAPESKQKKFTKDKIAVIYAQGEIIGGKGDDDKIHSETVANAIRKARMDKDVKAIVLRVNSPGGDALASDVMWRETILAKKEKPFIVSMGDYAASGGYYISCAADTIVAQPSTITGSIGVFGLLFNYKQLLNNKLGITTDTYKTGPYADIGTPSRPMTDSERKIIQHSVEKVYDTFTKHVADGRGMKQSDVDSIGQGRVWSAISAKQIGLVDVYGGLNDAVKIAAKKVKLDNYRIKELPEQKENILSKLINGLNDGDETKILQKELGENYRYYNSIKQLMKQKGVQAWFPYDICVE